MTEKDNILTSFNILHEMFKDRKYDLSIMNTYSDNEIQMIMDESGYDKGSNGSIFQIMMNKNMKLIYHMKSKYMKGELQKFLNSIDEEEDINHIIFVFKEKINSNNEKNIKSLIAQYNDKTSKHVKVEMFEIRNLLFNITKHSYVPKHVLLSTTEAELVAASDCVKMLLYIRRLLTEDFRMNIRTHYPTWGRQARVHSFSTRRWQLEKKETYSCGKQLFVRRSHHTCQWPYGT